jgi:hypothetical protein
MRLGKEVEVLGANQRPCHLVPHKSYITSPGIKPGPFANIIGQVMLDLWCIKWNFELCRTKVHPDYHYCYYDYINVTYMSAYRRGLQW